MSCNGIADILTRETGRYMPGEIYQRNFGTSPWVPGGLLDRGVYPAGLSEIISNLVYERNAPSTADPSWENVAVVDGQEGGACLPPTAQIEIGSTPRSFRLKRRALEGPDFCAEEFRSVFDLRKQLDSISGIIAERVRIEWEMHNRNEYFRMVQTKVVVDSCATPTEDTNTSESYPAACPSQTLGIGLLDKYRFRMIRDGAASSSLLTQNGTPVISVVASPEFISNMIVSNSERRQDIRWADSGKGDKARLLQMLGINQTYDNFMFIGDLFNRRFTCSGGVYTNVPPFLQTQATKGVKFILNSAYNSAPYEETVIFDREVMKQLVPAPITNPAPNFRFDPVSYVGDIKVLNIPNRVCNPDGNILFHRVVMAASSEPMKNWKGYAFVHLRCDPACNNATSCSS